ncbi:MAG: signal peptidase I [Caulobacteraceae bacterium]|nr:MAG: signal peptidase I [Caulobacteraceae bacterium]
MARDRSKDIYILDMPLPIAILAALSACVSLGFLGARVVYRPFRAPSASMQPAIAPGDYFIADKFAYANGRSPKRGDIVVFRPDTHPDRSFVKRVVGIGGDTVQISDGVLRVNGRAITSAPTSTLTLDDSWGGEVAYDVSNETSADSVRYRVLSLHAEPGVVTQTCDVPAGLPADTPGAESMCSESKPEGVTPGDDTQVYKVPDGYLFMLGDNRDNSADSRFEMGGFGYVPVASVCGKVTYVMGNETYIPQVLGAMRP